MTDTRERVIAIITEVLGLDDSETANLRKESGYDRMTKWDSMRHVEIIVALEDRFGLEIEERAIPKLGDVARIVAYLDNARSGADR